MQKIIGLFADPIGSLLAFIYGFMDNYGLSIILLTLIVRVCLLPLYSKQISYTAQMTDMQPKIKDIQTRYAYDKVQMNQKLQELYAKEKVNPANGCLPLVIQMPIIMGLFALLRSPLEYMTQPNMIAAVHESFLWVPDLCQPDNWILPIVAGLSTFFTFSQSMSAANSTADTGNMMNGMKYFFPIMIFLMGRTFPSGLSLYWAIGNTFQIGQTIFFNKKKAKETLIAEVEKEVKKEARKNKKNK